MKSQLNCHLDDKLSSDILDGHFKHMLYTVDREGKVSKFFTSAIIISKFFMLKLFSIFLKTPVFRNLLMFSNDA